MKVLRVCLEERALFKDAEGWGFQCPVWASIHHGDPDVMTFYLGSPVSYGTTFYPNNMHMGWVNRWNRRYSEDDAERWVKDMKNEGFEVSEEDFNCEIEFETEVDSADLSYLRLDIMDRVLDFAKEEGYDEVEEIRDNMIYVLHIPN